MHAVMFGPKIRNVFRSRWHAVAWASGVLLTAYCTVPAADREARRQTASAQPARHANPWAKAAK